MIERNITAVAKYFDFDGNLAGYRATIDGATCHIPVDTNNEDYKEIIAWGEQSGNTITEDDVPTP